MSDSDIQCAPQHKHLGILISSDLTWSTHINYICKKALVKINLMKAVKYKLSRKSLEIMYFTFVRSVLDYGDIVWDNCTSADSSKMESIQAEAARIVTGGTKTVLRHSFLN